jgi:hypothetical protein
MLLLCVFCFLVSWDGVRLSSLGTSATPAPGDRWWVWSNRLNKNWQGKPKYSEKICHNATLSTTNPTLSDPGSNQGCRGGKLVTNRLSYDTALLLCIFRFYIHRFYVIIFFLFLKMATFCHVVSVWKFHICKVRTVAIMITPYSGASWETNSWLCHQAIFPFTMILQDERKWI